MPHIDRKTCFVGLSVVVLVVAIAGGCQSIRRGGGGGDLDSKVVGFTTRPPAVTEAHVEFSPDLPAGQAILKVQFDRTDRRVKERVDLELDEGPVVVADSGKAPDEKKGDGIHSAVIHFDFAGFEKQTLLTATGLGQRRAIPVFSGRKVDREVDAKVLAGDLAKIRFDQDALRRGRAKIDLRDLVPIFPIDETWKSLLIVEPSVIADPKRTVDPCKPSTALDRGDPDGVWTFKHLVTEMANTPVTGLDPAVLVENWLRLWLTDQQPISGGFIASPRGAMASRILNHWPRAGGKLDLDQSPFRLAAIVNRIDLADNLTYGGGSAGEGRFVFGIVDQSAPRCELLPFSVIFEYGVHKRNCRELRDWARQWSALGSLTLGTPAYNSALEAITEQFARANAAPSKPNGSALNQLRTNENALNPIWELREFKIGRRHLLVEDTTKQSPDETLNHTARINGFATAASCPNIVNDRHVVPNFHPAGKKFLAVTSQAAENQFCTHFDGEPRLGDKDCRFHLSLNTCTGCHIADTATRFLHIDPQTMPATLSGFLRGNPSEPDGLFRAKDPSTLSSCEGTPPTIENKFHDLQRRAQKLEALANSMCLPRIIIPPLAIDDLQLDPRMSLHRSINTPLLMEH